MIQHKSRLPYLLRPLSTYLLAGLILVNSTALFSFNPFYLGSFFSFLFIIITPGFLLLPLFTKARFPVLLGIVLSVALSIVTLILVGLGLNTLLPLLGNHAPLDTVPLLGAFDVLIYILLVLNYEYKENSPFELHTLTIPSWILAGAAVLLPVGASLGAIVLNNGGTAALIMIILASIALIVPVVIFLREKISPLIPPLMLYMLALALLFMNSMRGWFVTGHDILLEYHVFNLTNNAHLWDMSLYQDPYMACLSLTILPTYLQSLMHVDPAYIYKFFMQFIGALSVVMVYYIAKEYTSARIAFLAGFLYITFPTFMVDMAFLNRQGIAFLFFGSMIFTMLTIEYFSGWKRQIVLVLFGTGMILSHYSTSYIAIPVLVGAYVVNRVMRWIIIPTYPRWYARLTDRLFNKDMYQRPVLIGLPFIMVLLCIMFVWSNFITKTSGNFKNTLARVIEAVEHPTNLNGNSGIAKYSLVQSKQATPEEIFAQLIKERVRSTAHAGDQADLYPPVITENYPVSAVPEALVPLTPLGQRLQAYWHTNLMSLLGTIKQVYAKVLQVSLLLGLTGLLLGFGIKKNILRKVPIEYIALSVAGITVMAGQTILPASAVDYGLLRLFQQNLFFLALPIIVGFVLVSWLVTRNHTAQLAIATALLIGFFVVLSGAVPQLTGGGRPLLPLNNYGLYYDAYYTHAQEATSLEWFARNAEIGVMVQSDRYFSNIKMISYAGIAPLAGLLPETTKKGSYVYLNFLNDKTDSVIEDINGDVVYYRFPVEFLDDNKDLIYSNGGSAIYR